MMQLPQIDTKIGCARKVFNDTKIAYHSKSQHKVSQFDTDRAVSTEKLTIFPKQLISVGNQRCAGHICWWEYKFSK